MREGAPRKVRSRPRRGGDDEETWRSQAVGESVNLDADVEHCAVSPGPTKMERTYCIDKKTVVKDAKRCTVEYRFDGVQFVPTRPIPREIGDAFAEAAPKGHVLQRPTRFLRSVGSSAARIEPVEITSARY